MSSLSFRSSVATVVKGDRSRMSDFGGDDVRELNYEDAPHDMGVVEEAYSEGEDNGVDNAEVLQESDVDGFRKTPSRNDRFSSSSFIEEERAVMVDKPYEVEVKTAQSPESSDAEEEEEHKYEAPRPTKIEDILPPARDENQNHSHGGAEEDMGSAKKAFAQYEAALKKTEAQKAADDDAERAELAKKKKVSDLISRFNTGAAFNQTAGNTPIDKGAYGVGKGSGRVNTGQFK